MGNTMFQLAFAHAASRRLGTSFVFGPAPLWEQFDLGPWGRPSVRILRKLAFRLKYGREPPVRTFIDNDRDPDEVTAQLCDGVAYGGFFQSERYFAGWEDEVRALFSVRRRHEDQFSSRYGRLKPYICMHIRRGDYLQTDGWALPTSYFLDALGRVDNCGRLDLVVVSDDPAMVRAELSGVRGARLDKNPPMVDLLLLMNADVVVTSNSSFSWWGAWLNRRSDVRIYAPQNWVGFAGASETPRDVIPKHWITVPVRDVGRSPVGR